MSRSLSRLQAAMLGLAVCTGLGLAGVGLFAIGEQQWLWGRTFDLYVGFPNVRGVEAGTRVRVLGTDAGEVVRVQHPDEPGQPVRLQLRLGDQFRRRIRADASAMILQEGMIGARVIEIDPGQSSEPIEVGATLAFRTAPELTDVLADVRSALEDIREGEGTVGKLIRDQEAYVQLLTLLQQGQETMESIKKDADALRRLPLLRDYVEDPFTLLVRPNCERNRQVFAEAELFEPGRAVLTREGRSRLDAIAPWLEGLKHSGSEVVVVSYAEPGRRRDDLARTLTEQQSEAVSTYLKEKHGAHKMGWWSTRRMTALGLGTGSPPVPETEPLPPARTEVIVFVPQS